MAIECMGSERILFHTWLRHKTFHCYFVLIIDLFLFQVLIEICTCGV